MKMCGASRNCIFRPILEEGPRRKQIVGLELLVDCNERCFGSIGYDQFGSGFESARGVGASLVHIFCPRRGAGLAKGWYAGLQAV